MPLALMIRSSTLPISCTLAAAQSANSSPGMPWLASTAARDAVRDDQRLLICDP